MAYSAITASHVGKHTRRVPGQRSIRPCARCGGEREARPTTSICQDCRDCLTSQERAIWRRRAA